jgi:hypothetical protein
MINDSEEIKLPIEQRILNALDKEFNMKSPGWRLSNEFKELIGHYVEMAVGKGVSNTTEQIIEFLKIAHHVEEEISIKQLIEYLKTNDFSYKPVKHVAQGRLKDIV